MYRLLTSVLFFHLLLPPAVAEDQPPLSDDTARINYSVGYQIGSDFRFQDVEIRPEAVIQGIRDALNDNNSQMSPEEMKLVMAELGKRLAEKKKQLKMDRLNQLRESSKRFHATNKDKPGVITTESGLQYRMVASGNGRDHPTKNDQVLVHYTGKLLDGATFDSSRDRGSPISFKVNGVIKGWTEALQLMKQGDRWQLFIPPDLAYGKKGSPPRIPPHSTLIFDVELLAIQSKSLR